MTANEFSDRLAARAARADLTVEVSETAQLGAYVELLRNWNRKINLTGLVLDPLSDEAIDRLLVEPLAAARLLSSKVLRVLSPESRIPTWFDLGSGGGSPAIPMKIAGLPGRLTMIESKSRKAAFLREVTRTLAFEEVEVVNARFEEIVAAVGDGADLITARAVRMDAEFAAVVMRLLHRDGIFAAFQRGPEPSRLPGLIAFDYSQLVAHQPGWLHLYHCVPRGTSRS